MEERTNFSTNGSGRTGYWHRKNELQYFSHEMNKNELKMLYSSKRNTVTLQLLENHKEHLWL